MYIYIILDIPNVMCVCVSVERFAYLCLIWMTCPTCPIHPSGLVHQCYLWWQAIVWGNWLSVRYFGQKLSGTQNLPEKHRPQLHGWMSLEISWDILMCNGCNGPSWPLWGHLGAFDLRPLEFVCRVWLKMKNPPTANGCSSISSSPKYGIGNLTV
jgi:hypothetical protein